MLLANSQKTSSSTLCSENIVRRFSNMSPDSQEQVGHYTIHRVPTPGLIQGPAGANLDVTA